MSPQAIPFLSGKMISRFEAIQNCLVPRSLTFSDQEKKRSQLLVNTVLKDQDETAKKKLAFFIILVDITAFMFHARLFRQLNATKQSTLLAKFFDSPIPIFRKGFWGLNTLARLGVYGQKELHLEIGYKLRSLP